MPIVRLGNNSTDDVPGLQLVELNSGLPDDPFGGETFARIRSDQHPLWLPTGLADAVPAGSTITGVTLGALRTNSSGDSSDASLFPLKKNAVPAQATWNSYSTGNAWEGGGATGASDVDPVADVWTFPGDNVADVYHEYIADADGIAAFQSMLDGTGCFGLAMYFGPDDTFDTQVRLGTANEDDGRRPYADIAYDEASSGVSAALFRNANQVIQ